jgi:glycosyltransferase involved in cell wall biosynthesis
MDSPTPLVSVIIPAYNCAPFIHDTLKSVYHQTYENWEIILIDDGSTDDTADALAPHMEKIRYHFQENRGTAAARNSGLREARGELIAFLDNDDLWLPRKLEMQVRALNAWPQCGLVFTDGMRFDESGARADSLLSKDLDKWIHDHITSDPNVAVGWLSREFFFRNHISTASSVMVPKEVVQSVGGFDERIAIADDYDLWLRIAQRYPVLLHRSCLYMWRWRASSQSGPTSHREHRWTEASIPVLEKHGPSVPLEIRAAVRRRLSQMYWSCGRAYFDDNRFHESRRMFLRCLRHDKIFVAPILFLLASYLGVTFVEKLRSAKRQWRTGVMAKTRR